MCEGQGLVCDSLALFNVMLSPYRKYTGGALVPKNREMK